jgi:hypothetical protein
MKRSKKFLIIIFKNVIECFRAKKNPQKIERTRKNALERLRTVTERLVTLGEAWGSLRTLKGRWTLKNA